MCLVRVLYLPILYAFYIAQMAARLAHQMTRVSW